MLVFAKCILRKHPDVMGVFLKKNLVFSVFIFLVLLNTRAFCAESRLLNQPGHEFALLGGYGITHRGYGDTKTQVQTFDILFRYGYFLSEELGRGHWYQGRHELLLEVPLHLAVDHGGRSMCGGTILGSWKFTALDWVTPYFFAGGGILYVDLGLPSMGSRINGTYQIGGGLQHMISENVAFTGEYRFHHISNLGTATPNEPLNSSKILFGITFFR